MLSNKAVPNEASVTSIVRLASAKKDGDYAFELIRKMNKEYKLVPRLRTLEEQKIAALLKVSSETGRGERVYEYLQKLRNSVRCVSEEMVKVIEDWFCGEKATRVKGLVSVDIDDAETEKFAESIAGLAMEREVKANFSEFQDWLEQDADDYEVIVDGANIGLYLQNFAEGGFSIPLSSLMLL
ncbi:hypothetical protein LWI29_036673 [Acer saccharum]|uniref:PROP1-like PPR domain-containing protein n=1 Tax=Acer saccharum TaxID=4024 RepID=A0AA39RJQ8_ACESA|nr:hypothetical protein LWI29_036673 [Acer saccharum]